MGEVSLLFVGFFLTEYLFGFLLGTISKQKSNDNKGSKRYIFINIEKCLQLFNVRSSTKETTMCLVHVKDITTSV